jgi:hypothetical protein
MWEIKETSPSRELQHGHTVVGAVEVPLTTLAATFVRGVIMRAPGAGDPVPNTDIVYVGRKGVTADSNVGTGGMPLLPGGVLELPLEDPSQIYVVSLSEGQDVAWMGV